jgi:hypothetical protein
MLNEEKHGKDGRKWKAFAVPPLIHFLSIYTIPDDLK